MTTEQVRSIITRITYKPGWTFTTTSDDGYSYVNVRIYWPVPETNPENAPDYAETQDYDNTKTLTIRTSDYSSEVEVLRSILETCIEWEQSALVHEAREFFRIKPEMSWAAPFHPHHAVNDGVEHLQGMNGQENWRSTSHRGLEVNRSLPQYNL
jgi:hypothetical protein